MDLQTGAICGGIIVLCAVVLFFISMLGMKEKTYEEAIAEQRKMPEENLLLGRSAKDKARDKKQKKAGKKVKEKTVEREKTEQPAVSAASTPTAVPLSAVEKVHVDFEEPEAEVEDNKKKKKKEKVKPILLNKDEHSPTVETDAEPANHFEEIQPKDDLLLKRRQSREEMVQKSVESPVKELPVRPLTQENSKEKVSESNSNKQLHDRTPSPPEDKGKPAKGQKQQIMEKVEKVNVSQQQAAPQATQTTQQKHAPTSEPKQSTPPPGSAKDRKKKKSELATLQQMSGDREGVNVSLLMPLVRKAELSRSEIQNLIDLLLNKQQGAQGDSEWIEGQKDPVVKLKKQLAEKEKALSEEQEVSQAFQAKMKELRAELNAERFRLTHSCRQLEESLLAKTQEFQGIHARLQHTTDTHAAEKQALQGQVQQIQTKLSEERLLVRKLQDEKSQIQASLEQELHNQHQQLDILKAHLSERHREAEDAYVAEITQLRNSMEEQENMNTSLTLELHNLSEAKLGRDEENDTLRSQTARLENQIESQVSRLHESEKQIRHLESQVSIFKELSEAAKDLARQLEDANGVREDLECHIHDLQNQLSTLQSRYTDVKLESERLREDNESLAAQVTAVTERPAAEGRENGDINGIEEFKKVDLVEHENIVKQKDAIVTKLSEEMNYYKTELLKLNEEIETQRSKNNDAVWKVRLEEQVATMKLLQRIFPDVHVEDNSDYSSWTSRFEASARKTLSDLSKPQVPTEDTSHQGMLVELEKQNSQLQAMVTHYKSIIEDTEGMLNRLQSHVEQEETKWRQQLQVKEAELEEVRSERDRLDKSVEQIHGAEEMQEKLRELQEKLQGEESEKRDLAQKFDEAHRSCSNLREQLDKTQEQLSSVEQLQKEIATLTQEFEQESEKNQDLSKEVVKLKSLVQIGEKSLSEEQKLVQSLQQELAKVNGENENHTATTNGPASEPSISESLCLDAKSTSGPASTESTTSEKKVKSRKKKGGSGKK